MAIAVSESNAIVVVYFIMHPASLHGKVMAEPLAHYLEQYIDSPTIKGIYLEQVI